MTLPELSDRAWPPPDLLEQVSNSRDLNAFLGSFERVRVQVQEYLTLADAKLSDFDRILDFGCGPGRFLFAMQPLLRAGQELVGCDINEACTRWAEENIEFARVLRNGIEPPLPFPDGHFDFIYGLSVFTHLSLDLQYKWACELHRVLKPNGLTLLTTAPPAHILHALAADNQFQKRMLYALNSDDLLCIFSENEHAPEGQREVAASHSLGAVRSIFSAFEHVAQVPISRLGGGQTVNLMRARPGQIYRPTTAPAALGAYDPKCQRSNAIVVDLPSGEHGALSFITKFGREVRALQNLSWRLTSDGASSHAPFPFSTAFGPNHLIDVRLEFPAVHEPLRVELLIEGNTRADATPIPFEVAQIRSEPR
ncbi:MAG: class I SAM-dependent methyltransferase, partial [Terricaulis sp.]